MKPNKPFSQNSRIRYYLSRYWLALTASFFLLSPYFSRYAYEYNRAVFHWTHLDLMALNFCIMVVGTIFYVLFLFFYAHAAGQVRKLFTLLFLAVFGLSIVYNIIHLTPLLINDNPFSQKVITPYYKYILLSSWLGFVVYAAFGQPSSLASKCKAFYFIISPVLIIYTVNALNYSTWKAGSGDLQLFLEEQKADMSGKPNIYIFIFDEWSYQRTFTKQNLNDCFVNLKSFNNQAVVFHQAYSPFNQTFLTIPAFIFQTFWRPKLRNGEIVFRVWKGTGDDNNFDLENTYQYESIFKGPQGFGYDTCIIGYFIPYGSLMKETIDYSQSYNKSKYFGPGFFGIALCHLITAAQSFDVPERFFCYFKNRCAAKIADSIHDLASTIIEKKHPVFGIFHYSIPHIPFIFTKSSPRPNLFRCCGYTPKEYYGNLAFMDTKIGEIISTLKKNNKYENSLIVMMSDHSWRKDPEDTQKKSHLAWRHVPCFIKFPYQKNQIMIETEFSTVKIGSIIKRYLNGEFDYRQARSIVSDKSFGQQRTIEEMKIR